MLTKHWQDIMESDEVRVVCADPLLPLSSSLSHTIVVHSLTQVRVLSFSFYDGGGYSRLRLAYLGQRTPAPRCSPVTPYTASAGVAHGAQDLLN